MRHPKIGVFLAVSGRFVTWEINREMKPGYFPFRVSQVHGKAAPLDILCDSFPLGDVAVRCAAHTAVSA
jgi:hypothetical protein